MTITTHSATREPIIIPGDDYRAADLARELGGRWVPVANGYALRRGRIPVFKLIYDAGFHARRESGKSWFRLTGPQHGLRLKRYTYWQALKAARRMKP